MPHQPAELLCAMCEQEHLHHETIRRARQVELLLAITWTINAATSEQELVRGVTKQAAEVCGAQLATIGIIDGNVAHFSLLNEAGEWRGNDYVLAPGGSISAHVAHTGRPYLANDLSIDPLSDHAFDAEAGYRQQVCVPLRGSGGAVLGVLSLYNKLDGLDFSAEDEHTLMTLAAQTAIALERARFTTERTAALESLRRSEQNYRTLMEQAADAILINVPGGPFLDVNQQACLMLGYSREELLALYPQDVSAPARLHDRPARLDELARGQTVVTERMITRQDGTTFAAEVSARRLEDGRVQALVRDISERRRVEDEVRFQASLLAAVGQAVIAITPDGTVTYWNRAAEQIYGWTAAEAIGRKVFDLNITTDPPTEAQAWIARVLAGESIDAEIMAHRRDGTVFPAWVSTSVLRDAAGNAVQIIGVTGDISTQKQAQADLQASEARFRSLVQNASDVIVVLGADGLVSYASPSVQRVLGYEPASQIGTDPFRLVHPDDRSRLMESFGSVVSRPGPHPPTEMRVRHADGAWRTFEASATNLLHDPAVRGVVENLHDITERKQAEASIHFQARLLESVGQSVIATDLAGRIIYWNDAATALYGWEREMAIGQNLRSLLVPREHQPDGAQIITRLSRGERWSGEFPLRHRDGRPLTVWTNNAPLVDEHGRLTALIGVSQDISERRQAERAIEHLAAIVEGSDDAILSAALDGTVLSWNVGAERIFGYRADEVLGRNIAMFAPPGREHECETMFERIIAGEPVLHLETPRRRKDGSLIDVAVTASALRGKAGQLMGISIIARDVTEQRRMAERLAAAEQLSAIGELAAGVAHEVNNPLAAIALSAELALRQRLPDQVRDDLRTVLREAQRAGDIVRALLRFARQREPVMDLIPVASALDEALALSEDRLARYRVTVTRRIARTPGVRADRDQLVQVFLNLINNAIDAMKQQGGGTLAVRVRRMRAGVEVAVADTGPGIAPGALARIFDPFFTTKVVDEGTGLGLSLSGSIIARHGGTLTAESTGAGACFRVTLPAERRGRTRGARVVAPATAAPVLVALAEPLAAEALAEAVRVLNHEAEVVSPSGMVASTTDAPAILIDAGVASGTIAAWRQSAPRARLIAVGDEPAANVDVDVVLSGAYQLADLEAALGGSA